MQQFVSEREWESRKEDFEFYLAISNDKQYMVLTTTFLYNVNCSLNYRSIRSWPLNTIKHINEAVNLNKYYRQDLLVANLKRVHGFGYSLTGSKINEIISFQINEQKINPQVLRFKQSFCSRTKLLQDHGKVNDQ